MIFKTTNNRENRVLARKKEKRKEKNSKQTESRNDSERHRQIETKIKKIKRNWAGGYDGHDMGGKIFSNDRRYQTSYTRKLNKKNPQNIEDGAKKWEKEGKKERKQHNQSINRKEKRKILEALRSKSQRQPSHLRASASPHPDPSFSVQERDPSWRPGPICPGFRSFQR